MAPCRLLFFGLLLLPIAADQRRKTRLKSEGLHVGLHAQVSPSQGFVVGSVITTAGLQGAFTARPEVSLVKTFYPFEYQGLHEHGPWDLIVIEGWFPMINSFIHEVRALSPHVVVLFYCLDPDFPGLHVIKALDVDGFLTNSRVAEAELREVAPTHHLLLAADVDMPRCTDETAHKYANLSDKVVFVGSAVGMSTKALLPAYLREAAELQGLALLGKGWDSVPEFAPFWHGVLPQEDLCCAYSQALAVLGVTMDGQRAAGMINNRVFEALACSRHGQARLITEPFEEVEQIFGQHVRYLKAPGDMARHLREIRDYEEAAPAAPPSSSSTRRLIEQHHTYHQRVRDILGFVASTDFHPASRRGRLQVLVLHEAGLTGEKEYGLSLGPALRLLHDRGSYHFTMAAVPADGRAVGDGGPVIDSRYDAVWVVGGFDGAADRYLRSHCAATVPETPRGLVQRRLLLLWGETSPSDTQAAEFYDAIYYKTEWDRQALRHRNLQHAYGVSRPPSTARHDVAGSGHVVLVGRDADGAPWPPHLASQHHHHNTTPSALTLACFEGTCPLTASAAGWEVLGDLSGLDRLLSSFSPASLSVAGRGLPLWALVGAAVLSSSTSGSVAAGPVTVWGLDERLTDVATYWPEAWDIDYYADRMVAGMTRTLCLGRGGSSVRLDQPSNYTVVAGGPGPRHVRVGVSTTAFDTGQDGSWCLLACGRLVVCVQREQIDLVLTVQPPAHRPVLLELRVELRSNIYRDVIAESAPVFLLVPPAADTQAAACEPPVALAGHTLIYQPVDLAQLEPLC